MCKYGVAVHSRIRTMVLQSCQRKGTEGSSSAFQLSFIHLAGIHMASGYKPFFVIVGFWPPRLGKSGNGRISLHSFTKLFIMTDLVFADSHWWTYTYLHWLVISFVIRLGLLADVHMNKRALITSASSPKPRRTCRTERKCKGLAATVWPCAQTRSSTHFWEKVTATATKRCRPALKTLKKRNKKKKHPKKAWQLKCTAADGPRSGAGEEVWVQWKALVCAGTLPGCRTATYLAAPTPTGHLLMPERSILCINQIFILQNTALMQPIQQMRLHAGAGERRG